MGINRKQDSSDIVFFFQNSAMFSGSEKVLKVLLEIRDLEEKDENGLTVLHSAVLEQKIEILKILLEKGCSVNTAAETGWTPLHSAALKGNELIVKLLLDHDANINAKDCRGLSALHVAAGSGHVIVVELLLDRKFNINDASLALITPLHLAIKTRREDVVKFLLEHGADVDAADEDNQTALCFAAGRGSEKILNYILQFKPNVENENNRTALRIAILRRYKKIIELLLNYGITISSRDLDDSELFLSSVIGGHADVVENLLERGFNVENTAEIFYEAFTRKQERIIQLLVKHGFLSPKSIESQKEPEDCFLHMVVRRHNQKSIQFALENGADVNSIGKFKSTALHVACKERCAQIVKLLLNHKADPNMQDKDGLTPLHIAIKEEEFDTAKLLLETESDVNIATNSKSTPLHFAVQCSSESYLESENRKSNELVDSLLRLGADLSAKDEDNRTPLHLAIDQENEDAVNAFLDKNPDINERDNKLAFIQAIINANCSSTIVKIFLNRGFNIKSEDLDVPDMPKFLCARFEQYSNSDKMSTIVQELLKREPTPQAFLEYNVLRSSVEIGCFEIFRKIFRRDMNVKVHLEGDDTTLLHLACCNFRKDGDYKNIIKELLKHGAEINAVDHHKLTPLHESVRHGTEDIVALLLKHGADVDARDSKDETPLILALRKKHPNVQVLLDAGANVNAARKNGLSPLHVAIKFGCEYCVRLLLHYDAEINVGNVDYKSPLKLARAFGDTKSVEILLDNGARDYTKFSDYSTVNAMNILLSNHKIRTAVINNIEISTLSGVEKKFREECEEEIKRLKCEILGRNVSVYDVLTKNDDDVARYMRNEKVVKILDAGEYETRFPIYSKLLKIRVLNAKKRNQLTSLGGLCLGAIFSLEKRIPELILREIFPHLSNLDLRNLIHAAPIGEDEKASVRCKDLGVSCSEACDHSYESDDLISDDSDLESDDSYSGPPLFPLTSVLDIDRYVFSGSDYFDFHSDDSFFRDQSYKMFPI